MPDIATLLQTLGIQQPSGNPARGEAQYPNPWSGFAAGMQDASLQRTNLQRSRVEQTRNQLLSMINSIPDSEQNTPMKFKLAMDIMSAGDKHWSDKVLAPTKADDLIGGMYKLFQDKFPQDQPNTGVAIGDNGQAIAARPRIAQTATTQGTGLAGVLAGDPTTGSTLPVSPAPQPGKFAFEDKGKWKDINEVFQDEKTGDKYLIQIDSNTGRTKRLNLGRAKTVSEINTEVKAQRYAGSKAAAIDKKYYERAIGLSGLGSAQLFESLPVEIKEDYLSKAAQALMSEVDLKNTSTKTGIDLKRALTGSAQAGIPLKQAQTANILAQPKDPNAVTADEQRTLKAMTETLDADIRRYQKVTDNPDNYSRKQVTEAKTKLEELIRQRNAIRNKILQPTQRLDATRPKGAAPARIPSGTSGPVGAANDPLGIRR